MKPKQKSRGRPTCFYCGKPGHFQKNCRHFRKDKGGIDGVQPKRIQDNKNTSAIATSEEESLLISEQNEVNLVSDESTWVVDSGTSFHLLCTHNVGEGRSLIFTLVKGMFTIIKKGTNDWIE